MLYTTIKGTAGVTLEYITGKQSRLSLKCRVDIWENRLHRDSSYFVGMGIRNFLNSNDSHVSNNIIRVLHLGRGAGEYTVERNHHLQVTPISSADTKF
jgi:hypothetical protein